MVENNNLIMTKENIIETFIKYYYIKIEQYLVIKIQFHCSNWVGKNCWLL